MSRTIPIWACVINRTCYRLRSLHASETAPCGHEGGEREREREEERQRWEQLRTPPWVGESERAQIEKKLGRFVDQLLASDQLTLEKIRENLKTPLRPVWIAPEYPRPWRALFADPERPDFTCGGTVTPLVLVSTAQSPGDDPQYIPGAGDDEESWAMGLTPVLFWEHHDYILEYSSPDVVEDRIREEKQRRTQAIVDLNVGSEQEGSPAEGTATHISDTVHLHWIGQTGVAVADDLQAIRRPDVRRRFGLVISCDDVDAGSSHELHDSATAYLHVPLPQGKRDKHKVGSLLGQALPAAYQHLREGRTVLVHSCQSLATASFLCMAILLRYFDSATWRTLQETPTPINKQTIQKALLFVAAQVPQGKGPSRALMKELNKFFMPTASFGL